MSFTKSDYTYVLKSFGQEIKNKTNKREFFCVSIKRGLITHSTNTPKYIKKILKSWSYALIETEVWNTYCWIMVYTGSDMTSDCFFHSLKYDRYTVLPIMMREPIRMTSQLHIFII